MRRVVGGLLMLLLANLPVEAGAPEYQAKAAILAHLALFVEWPAQAFSSAGSPFVACVVGEAPLGPWLQAELSGQVGGHPLEVRRLEKMEAARECHLLFISRSAQPRLAQVLSRLRQAATLTVSDVVDLDDFCRQGGMIGLATEGGKVYFKLNTKATAKVGLEIGSQLKRVARSTKCGGG